MLPTFEFASFLLWFDISVFCLLSFSFLSGVGAIASANKIHGKLLSFTVSFVSSCFSSRQF